MDFDLMSNKEENQIIFPWLFSRTFFSFFQADLLQAAVSQYELLQVGMYLSTWHSLPLFMFEWMVC